MRPISLSQTGAATTVLAAVCAALMWPQLPGAISALAGNDFPAALQGLATIVGSCLVAWILLIVAAGVAQLTLPGVPRALRATLFTGVAVAATTVPASADTGHDLDGLRLPDRPSTSQAPTDSQLAAPTEVSTQVAVRPGDSLWSLAADRLADRASTADIASAAQQWFDANRDVIGSDPNLIHPGQQLTVPTNTLEERS